MIMDPQLNASPNISPKVKQFSIRKQYRYQTNQSSLKSSDLESLYLLQQSQYFKFSALRSIKQTEKSRLSLPNLKLKQKDVQISILDIFLYVYKAPQQATKKASTFIQSSPTLEKQAFQQVSSNDTLYKIAAIRKLEPLPLEKNIRDADGTSQDYIYAIRTKAGCTQNRRTKKNQDAAFFNMNLFRPGNHFFGVCDGHGQYGHIISNYIEKKLPEILAKELVGADDIEEAFYNSFIQTNEEVLNLTVDCKMSGSTVSSLLIQKQFFWTANVGDSRAIICRENDGQWKSIPITNDHKPDVEQEKQRILKAGGKIDFQRDSNGDPIGPLRVWLSDGSSPGLAMTRSIGDKIGAIAGVISEPEILEFRRQQQDRFILIASDGVWEFLSNDDVMNIIIPYYQKNQVEEACDRVISEAVAAWRYNGTTRDDITCIIIFLQIQM